MSTRCFRSFLAAAVAAILLPACGGGNDGAGGGAALVVQLISVTPGGTGGRGSSRSASISGDGSRVAFESEAYDLDSRDGNTITDVYVRDASAGTTTLVSLSSAGASGGNNFSSAPAISPDGRFVAFTSLATNLVAGMVDLDGPNQEDVYLRDLVDGVTVLVSCASGSATTTGNAGILPSRPAVVSDASAAYVAFISNATDHVAGGTTGSSQVFLRRIPLVGGSLDNAGGSTVLVSQVGGPTTGCNSGNMDVSVGQDATSLYVAWGSWATNLSGLDVNAQMDVYWRAVDKATGAAGPATLVSVNSAGTAGGGNGSGGFVESRKPVISVDGAFVAWESTAVDLVVADTNGSVQDIFERGPMTALPVTIVVSRTSTGSQPIMDCSEPSISATGEFVAFQSDSPDLVPGDLAIFGDVFLRDVTAGTTLRVSVTQGGGEPDWTCRRGAVSGDGRYVAFDSPATNITAGSGGGFTQVYRRGF